MPEIWLKYVLFDLVSMACLIHSIGYYVAVPENHVFFSKEVIKEGRKDKR
jgi:hypothetical protein